MGISLAPARVKYWILIQQPYATLAVLGTRRQYSLAEIAKKHKVNGATIYAWRKHFGQMQAADVKRLKALELENSRLEKLLAERDLDIEILKEINAKKWCARRGDASN